MVRLFRRFAVAVLVFALAPAGQAAAGPDTQPASRPAATTQKVLRPTTAIPPGGCVTSACHPGLKAQPFTHGPVQMDECAACHEAVDPARHTFKLARSGGALCTECHELELNGKSVHPPVAGGECVECHDPHGAQNQLLLRVAGGSLCTQCHADITGGMEYVHGPVAVGACRACHRGHASEQEALLVKPGRALCLDCHATLKKKLDSVRIVHDPAAADCLTCHRPHAGERPMMLTDEPEALCLGCHDAIETQVDDATVKHGAVSTGRACANCHDPHGSDQDALLRSDMLSVCLTCHDRPVVATDGTHLADLKAVRAPDMTLHGPVAQGECDMCHQVHGGANFRLLTARYPAEFYAPFSVEAYALCFACHDAELAVDEHTTDATDFRDGDRNLHFVHVDQPKGRTCRACHNAHASKSAKLIRAAVPFGASGWELPLNYLATETGGRCGPGCHLPRSYDRVHPVGSAWGTAATQPGSPPPESSTAPHP